MCVFCAAIPVAATAGITVNSKQLEAKRQAQAAGVENPHVKPVMQVTAGIILLLMICSVTYHTLTNLPY
jgi:ABC-type nickel/cobalt efflux system permease component RcnA